MEGLIRVLSMVQNLSWMYESPPHVQPVLQVREALSPLLSDEWSRATVTVFSAIVSSLLALGLYYMFIKPAAHIIRWLAWLAFVVGLPLGIGWLTWNVPSA